MVLNKNPQLTQIRNVSIASRKYARMEYEIPERYRNSFYLANAAFFDSTNWFLHRAYEVVFPTLKKLYRASFQDRNVGDVKIHEKLENIVEILDQCNSIVDVRFPVVRESGNMEIIRGFRAHYGETVRQTPCLGGLRINENITRDHMKALSVLSAMKNSCVGIGLSGAHGGIKINSKQYSESELRNIVELYITELYKKGYCGYRDVMHPDINTSAKEMKWITDTVAKCSGQIINAAAVGKATEDGGIVDNDKAAAMGALKALEMFLNNANVLVKMGIVNVGLKDKTFILQGLGKVGRPLGLMMIEKGAICVGVKEQEAYLYDANGIDLDKLLKHRDETGSIEHFGLTKTDHPDSIYTEHCDILVLAACQKSMVCYIARDVKAKIILEASDGPVTPTAHKILTTKAKLVVPDIYACAGATVASYFEYLRNLHQMGISEEIILRFSDAFYANIFKSLVEDKQQAIVGGASTHNVSTDVATLESSFTINAIDSVFSSVGREILNNLEIYRLETDVRTAAYAVAIKNMFKTIYEQQKII